MFLFIDVHRHSCNIPQIEWLLKTIFSSTFYIAVRLNSPLVFNQDLPQLTKALSRSINDRNIPDLAGDRANGLRVRHK